ncbi:MAG TPA: ABC transporter ATP-binding protein [Fimbriimonadaceae bacterium]|nr:ABC transporter ATP-binding protein [Fimbriimonadaceae bacterium]
MTPSIVLDEIALFDGAGRWGLTLHAGEFVAVVGPTGAGKSTLLEVLGGKRPPVRGQAGVTAPTASSLRLEGERTTPRSVAQKLAPRGSSAAVTEALVALHLWDRRQLSLEALTDGERAAVALLPVWVPDAPILLIDGTLDHLDPWRRAEALAALRARSEQGATIVVATHDVALASAIDTILVLHRGEPRYFGSARELIAASPRTELRVTSRDGSAVTAVADAFEVTAEAIEGGWRIYAADGQALAARLLTEGYGAVDGIVLLRPTLTDVLSDLLAGP